MGCFLKDGFDLLHETLSLFTCSIHETHKSWSQSWWVHEKEKSWYVCHFAFLISPLKSYSYLQSGLICKDSSLYKMWKCRSNCSLKTDRWALEVDHMEGASLGEHGSIDLASKSHRSQSSWESAGCADKPSLIHGGCSHNFSYLKDLLLVSWCQIPRHNFRNAGLTHC